MKKKKEIYRSLKAPITNLIRNPETLQNINNIVIKINQLRTHSLLFTKLYFIHLYDNNLEFPLIDRGFFQCVVRVLTVSERKRPAFTKNEELFKHIQKFYISHYKSLRISDDLDVTSYRTIINYMITDIITDLENNIKMRFYNHVKNYVYSIYYKDDYINNIKKIEKNTHVRKKLIRIKMKHIKNAIDDIYKMKLGDLWIKETFNKNSIPYDIECVPQEYIRCMIYMNKTCEKNDSKILNIFPLKRSIVPGHIRLDTESIVDIFVTENKKLYKSTGGIEMYKDFIWNEFFKMDKKIFNSKDFKFNGSIQTDGFSISILQSKNGKVGKFTEMYIDDKKIKDKVCLKNLNLVSIDPNKDDLIYCASGSKENEDFKIFRYTQMQRNKEMYTKKHKRVLEHEKYINDISEIENELSEFNSKTNDFNEFSKYIKKKNDINERLKIFYERVLWRKNRLSSYVGKTKSEQKMLKKFKEKFGNSDETLIAFGDWSQKEQMKFKQPSKGKSFRSLFRKAGYKVYLIDEYKTSKQCCNCKDTNAINEKFLKVMSPRPWKRDTEIMCHGLVKCKTCNTMFNRDTNSVVNIRNIALCALNDMNRPSFLCR